MSINPPSWVFVWALLVVWFFHPVTLSKREGWSRCLKCLIKTCPNMSISRCRKICPNMHVNKEGMVSVNAVVLMQPGRHCVYLCESKSTWFGLPKVDAIWNHWLIFVYNRTAQPICSNLCNTFNGRQFREPRRLAVCAQRLFKKMVNSEFALTILGFWISDCKYVLLLV